MEVRVLCTGQSGLDKKSQLQAAARYAQERYGRQVRLFHVGDMMYAADPRIPPGKILDVDLPRLHTLRRLVFRDILRALERENLPTIIDTHATFRWRRGLFIAFDFEDLHAIQADIYVTIVDDIDAIKLRLLQAQPSAPEFTLKDLLVWREEEIIATELMSRIPGKRAEFYILARPDVPVLLPRLMFEGKVLRKAYISFPISHVMHLPEVVRAINAFRRAIRECLITFDPYTLQEKRMEYALKQALEGSEVPEFIEIPIEGERLRLPTAEVQAVLRDIDGQIVSRDFRLIDQSDLILAFFPDDGGEPIISPGVMRELTYAHHTGKDTYIIWTSPQDPSPFVEDVVVREMFRSLEEALDYFRQPRHSHREEALDS